MSALGLWAAVATGLGSYNLARFLAMRAIKRRRQIREAKRVAGNVKRAHDFIEKMYYAAADGVDEKEAAKIRAIVTKVKDEVLTKKA